MTRKIISQFLIKNLQLLENQVFGSEKNFAKAIKKSPQAFNHYTQGKSMPTIETLLLIEELTSIPIKRLLTEDLERSEFFRENTEMIDNTVLREPPQSPYQKAEPIGELSEIKEKLDMLWKTNLHRAEKMEEWEMRLKLVERALGIGDGK